MLLNEPVDNPASEMVFTNYALRNTLYGFELQVFVKCLYPIYHISSLVAALENKGLNVVFEH